MDFAKKKKKNQTCTDTLKIMSSFWVRSYNENVPVFQLF